MKKLQLINVFKTYDNGFEAVKDVNIDIDEGEFVVFVGPSGCGKTTTLRMIAGLEEITRGKIILDDVLINDLLPRDREIAMVFQSYALYPHMSIYKNLAFGLILHNIPDEEIDQRVRETAKALGIEEYLDSYPRQLSGGQRQRVALGRAIVRHAKVFLMDEPLSNLDAKLRGDMRREIIRIHRSVGATTIYVTHDQTEAMTMATRIVIMNKGVVQQIGTPDEVYTNPNNLFVASFIGAPKMNFLRGVFNGEGVRLESGQVIALLDSQKALLASRKDSPVIIGVRPEQVVIDDGGEFGIKVDVLETLGYETLVHGRFNGEKMIIRSMSNVPLRVHQEVAISFNREKFHFFDGVSEEVIR